MRGALKRGLAVLGGKAPGRGATVLIYHRVGGGSADERDTPAAAFEAQLDVLARHDVVSLDAALDRLDAGDDRPCVVLTFDDGFADVHAHAWPMLRERGLPFTVYVATAYVGREMQWEGSTARSTGAALTWDQLGEMAASGLCTVGNHTHTHARPHALSAEELDRCSDDVEARLGTRPRHFAYPWGIAVPALDAEVRARFRSAATGDLGRNLPGADPVRLARVPVRRSDPVAFFAAKLMGDLWPERAYAGIVRVGKRVGARA
jgi:peptidoglycan/xylan/chitin deacetylase (PgdA/CDA1 family)